MEIGAVKQAFNNELILLKKNLNQARIQIIHKLTRKAKQLTEKKAPDALKEKFKRKAESAVKEVLIIKKIKSRDIGKFAITHKGTLEQFLNKPQVNLDKACARLLLHKSLQEKYKFLRNKFSNIPIKDLFMSRQERIKLKKEEQAKKKDKRKKNKVVNAEGDWDVEDVNRKGKTTNRKGIFSDVEELSAGDDNKLQSDVGSNMDDQDMPDEHQSSDLEASDPDNTEGSIDEDNERHNDEESAQENNSEDIKADSDAENDTVLEDFGNLLKMGSHPKEKKVIAPVFKNPKSNKLGKKTKTLENVRNKQEKKQKDSHKNKNLKDKILNKKFKSNTDDVPSSEAKVVDPFFITATGENYLSVAEPRQPDEFKEEHRQGNRKLRRAIMFGHVPKNKPRRNFDQQNGNFNRQHNYLDRESNQFDRNNKFNKQSHFDKSNSQSTDQHNDFKGNNYRFNRNNKFDDRNTKKQDEKPEKLHPSWEAKKKQSGILPFQGKKIVFNDG